MPEEKKLGPNATYNPNEGEGAPSVTMGGVTFVAGEAVDVVKMLGEEKGQEALKRLAGNPSFKVDGGPDHTAQVEAKKKAEEKAREAEQKAREKEAKAQMPAPAKPADDERQRTATKR